MSFADGFWEIKNLNDVIAVVGLALTLLSIWLAVYFARRDLQRTIEAARKEARATLERFALTLLQRELAELNRWVRSARDASRRREWVQAELRLDDAEAQLAVTLHDPRLSAQDSNLLRRASDDVAVLRNVVAKLRTANASKTLPPARLAVLDKLVRVTAELESRIRHRVLETDNDLSTGNGTVPPTPPQDESR